MYPDNLDVRPLTTWPGELTPPSKQRHSPFSASLTSTVRQLSTELGALKAKRPILEVAIPGDQWRVDGRPRASARATHPGVVLSLPETTAGPLRYATDVFWTWQENLRAIVLGMEALRRVDRYGITKRGEQYAGFRALPRGGASLAATAPDARVIICELAGVSRGAIIDGPVIRAAKIAAHPDRRDGDSTAWHELEAALRLLGLAS
jgi:hypothetical protein